MTRVRRFGFVVSVLTLVAAISAPALARTKVNDIVLPGATSAEGITGGAGNTFYAGDLFAGDIYTGDVQKGTAHRLIDVPEGRNATGMQFDDDSGLLFVAGGFTGQGYVYDTATGATVATYQFADPNSNPIINDVTLTPQGVWFTNSSAPVLYFVPLVDGVPGPFSTLNLTGPAADLTGQFNNNGIVSTPDGSRLIVAHTADAALYTVDPSTGASAPVAGVSVPNVDGIIMQGRTLWAIRNFDSIVSKFRLSPNLGSGTTVGTITSTLFEVPTTGFLHGGQLAIVNAKFDTGFPPTADQYDVVIVPS